MTVELLFVENCPNHAPALALLRAILRLEGIPAQVTQIAVKDEAAAQALRFCGSPTIRVNGQDLGSGGRVGMGCRFGDHSIPAVETIRVALRNASRSQAKPAHGGTAGEA